MSFKLVFNIAQVLEIKQILIKISQDHWKETNPNGVFHLFHFTFSTLEYLSPTFKVLRVP